MCVLQLYIFWVRYLFYGVCAISGGIIMGQENTGKSKHTAIKVIGTLLLIAAAAFIVWFKWFGGRDVLIGSKLDQEYDCGDFMIKMESTMKQADQDELDEQSKKLTETYKNPTTYYEYSNHDHGVVFDAEIIQAKDSLSKEQQQKLIDGGKKSFKQCANYKEISSDDNRLSFTADIGGQTQYCLVVFKTKGSKFYRFDFTCKTNDRDDYESRFDKWADSITLV